MFLGLFANYSSCSFLCDDLSNINHQNYHLYLISVFQFCLMEHYYECPISVLCCVSPKCRKDILDKMTHKQVEMCRKTLSFRRWADLCFLLYQWMTIKFYHFLFIRTFRLSSLKKIDPQQITSGYGTLFQDHEQLKAATSCALCTYSA